MLAPWPILLEDDSIGFFKRMGKVKEPAHLYSILAVLLLREYHLPCLLVEEKSFG